MLLSTSPLPISNLKLNRVPMGPAELAMGIRQLSIDVYKSLSDPLASPETLLQLSSRITELRRVTENTHMDQIDRWLRNAQIQVDRRRITIRRNSVVMARP